MSMYHRPNWKDFKFNTLNQAYPGSFLNSSTIDYYDIVYYLTDLDTNSPVQFSIGPVEDRGQKAMAIFSSKDRMFAAFNPLSIEEYLLGNFTRELPKNIRIDCIMLGKLVQNFESHKSPTPLIVNPVLMADPNSTKLRCLFEDVIFAPIRDPHSKKLMITDPQHAKALYAINPKDQAKFGVETIFHIISGTDLPIDDDQRAKILKDEIDELSFFASRVPIQKGSTSLYVVILNLDNEMEETAFIRPYQTFDYYSKIIFVNSSLQLSNGSLENIPYDNRSIEGVFSSLIDWNKKQKKITLTDSI